MRLSVTDARDDRTLTMLLPKEQIYNSEMPPEHSSVIWTPKVGVDVVDMCTASLVGCGVVVAFHRRIRQYRYVQRIYTSVGDLVMMMKVSVVASELRARCSSKKGTKPRLSSATD